jgi:hypothetical protein
MLYRTKEDINKAKEKLRDEGIVGIGFCNTLDEKNSLSLNVLDPNLTIFL